jgi:hypothetical protein
LVPPPVLNQPVCSLFFDLVKTKKDTKKGDLILDKTGKEGYYIDWFVL